MATFLVIDKGSGQDTFYEGMVKDVINWATLEALIPPASASAKLLLADGTVGRVLRSARVACENGSNAATVKCTIANNWNGDTVGATDNVPKNGSAGNFALNAGGTELTVLATGISGDCVGILSTPIQYNLTATALTLYHAPDALGTGFKVAFYNAATGAALDITTLVDTGTLYFDVVYVTSA